MFTPASKLYNLKYLDRSHPSRHIIGTIGTGTSIQLRVYDHDREQIELLEPGEFDWYFSQDNMCTGKTIDDHHSPCPERRRVGKFSQCASCALPEIPKQACIFEPKCKGEMCEVRFCSKEHVVYLAFFNDLMKIGMTGRDRVGRRMLEQGADAYSVVAITPNRFESRRLEKDLGRGLELRQAYRNKQVLETMTQPFDKESVDRQFGETRNYLEDRYDLHPTELTYFRESGTTTLDDLPELIDVPGRHRGRFVGAYGKFFVYEADGMKALLTGDIVGRFLLDVMEG